MMIENSNVLIFDEPTDHLDMEAITALNNGMIKFPGTILFACRDHQVVQTTANRIIEFMPDGTIVDKVTTYDEYLENDEMARKRQVYSMSESDEADNQYCRYLNIAGDDGQYTFLPEIFSII